MEPQPSPAANVLLASDLCPPVEVETPPAADLALRVGHAVSVHVREDGVWLQWQGQRLGGVEDSEAARMIADCHKAGRAYVGRVTAVKLGRVEILLECQG